MTSKRKTDQTLLSPSPVKRITRSTKDSNILVVVDHHEVPENLKLWAWDVKSTEKKKRMREYSNNDDAMNTKASKTPSKKDSKTPNKKDLKMTEVVDSKTPASDKKSNLKTVATPKMVSGTKENISEPIKSASKVSLSNKKKIESNSNRKSLKSQGSVIDKQADEIINTSTTKLSSVTTAEVATNTTPIVIKVTKKGWSVMDYLMIVIFAVIIIYALSLRSDNILKKLIKK